MNDVELLPPQFELLSWMVGTERSQLPEKQYKGFKAAILFGADIEMISRATDKARKRCDLPHLTVLKNAGFVETNPLPGEFIMTHIMLTPAGFSYYDKAHALPEGLAQEKRNLVDTKVSQAFPVAVGHLKNAHDALWVDQSGGDWSGVAHDCWEALKFFAEGVYKPEYAREFNEAQPDPQHYNYAKDALDLTMRAHTPEEKGLRALLVKANAYLHARRHDKGTTQQEAKRLVLFSYLLISEIYELLNPSDETQWHP